MPDATARDTILRLFHEGGPRKPEGALAFRTLLDALSPGYAKGTVSARLSELVQEGILEKDERGKFRLVYAEGGVPKPLQDLSTLLLEQLPRRALHQTVLWDATALLAARGNGVVAPVHVVETARSTGGGTARMLIDRWQSEPVPHIQEFAERDALLEAVVGEFQVSAPRGARRVLVGPVEGRYASTVLHRTGIRLATPERALVDFLGLRESSAVDAVRLGLTSTSVNLDPDRLFAAAHERALLPSLFAVLNQFHGALPARLEESYRRKLSGTARALVGGPNPKGRLGTLLRERRKEILAVAGKYGALEVRVFGSVARGEADEKSDLDLLVRFERGRSLLDQIALQQDLEELLGVKVDVVSVGGLSPYIKNDVLREAVPV